MHVHHLNFYYYYYYFLLRIPLVRARVKSSGITPRADKVFLWVRSVNLLCATANLI